MVQGIPFQNGMRTVVCRHGHPLGDGPCSEVICCRLLLLLLLLLSLFLFLSLLLLPCSWSRNEGKKKRPRVFLFLFLLLPFFIACPSFLCRVSSLIIVATSPCFPFFLLSLLEYILCLSFPPSLHLFHFSVNPPVPFPLSAFRPSLFFFTLRST